MSRHPQYRSECQIATIRKRGLRFILIVAAVLAWISIAPALALSQIQNTLAPKEVESELNLLVQQFLFSEDEQQREALLKEILSHKAATIDGLKRLIQNGGLYPPGPSVGSLHQSIHVRGYEMSYALYVPENYDPQLAYPLIVCLHGAGFEGDSYLDRWKTRLGEKSLLLCPTIGAGAWWSPQGEALVMAAVDAVMSKYRIDPERVFLTGMSNGGIGTYLVGIFHSDRFSAFAPMAGGIPEEIFPFLKNFSTAGTYIIHGAADQVMPVDLSRKVSAYLKKAEIPHVYREHTQEHPSAGGHFFPREELPALVDWFEGQKRIADPATLISVRDKVHLAPYYWTEINETDGEVADLQQSIFDNTAIELVRDGIFPTLKGDIQGNRVLIESQRVKKMTLFFNNRLIDFSKPVVISVNGKTHFEGLLSESPTLLLKEAHRRKDRLSFYSASLTIDLSTSDPKK